MEITDNINAKGREMENKVLILKNKLFLYSFSEFGFDMMLQIGTFVLLAEWSTDQIERLSCTRTEHFRAPINLAWPA